MHQQHTIHFSRSAIHQTRHQSLFPVCPACIENTSLVLIMICDQLNPQMQYQYNPLTATRKIKPNISTVCMQKQASAITKSCYFQICNIGRIRSYINEDVWITLVCSLVTSCLDYANALLYGTNTNIISQLQHVQNTAAARLITRY